MILRERSPRKIIQLRQFNVNSRSGFQPHDARLKYTKIVSRASRGSRFYSFVELTLSLDGNFAAIIAGDNHRSRARTSIATIGPVASKLRWVCS